MSYTFLAHVSTMRNSFSWWGLCGPSGWSPMEPHCLSPSRTKRLDVTGWLWMARYNAFILLRPEWKRIIQKLGISESDISIYIIYIYKWQTLGVLVPADDPSTFSYYPPTSGVQATGHLKSLGYFPLLMIWRSVFSVALPRLFLWIHLTSRLFWQTFCTEELRLVCWENGQTGFNIRVYVYLMFVSSNMR